MFFINILIVLHWVTLKVIDSINSKLTLSLYLDEQYDNSSIEYDDLKSSIKQSYPEVNISYKNKDQVLESLRDRDPELVKILEKTNPLPETITLSNIDLDSYNGLNGLIEQKSFILAQDKQDAQHFANYKVQYNKINDVIGRLQLLQTGLYAVIAIFVISIGVIIYSVIGNFVYYFKDEIYITRLVGGWREFIYGPFVIQGAIYAIASFALSLIIFVLWIKNMSILLPQGYDLSFILSGQQTIFILQMILFALIGGLSGYMSSKKYLRQK